MRKTLITLNIQKIKEAIKRLSAIKKVKKMFVETNLNSKKVAKPKYCSFHKSTTYSTAKCKSKSTKQKEIDRY